MKKNQDNIHSRQVRWIFLFIILFVVIFISIFKKPSDEFTRQVDGSQYGILINKIDYGPTHYLDAIATTNNETFYIHDTKLYNWNINLNKIIWENSKNRFELRGVRSLIDIGDYISALTSTHIIVFSKSTGDKVWLTTLGDGHVGAQQQVVENDVLVYYGDEVILIDRLTGKIKDRHPQKDLLWRDTQIEIVEGLSSNIEGHELSSNLQIWDNPSRPFRTDRYFFPEKINKSKILIRTPELGICVLNYLSGEYQWCRDEIFLSDIGIDHQNNIAYAIRDDYTLMGISLATGKVVKEIRFSPKQVPADLQLFVFDYYVRVSMNRVLVYFGDSNQLFVLDPLNTFPSNNMHPVDTD